MNFNELLEKAMEMIDEAYNMTEYNTKECKNLLEVKYLINELLNKNDYLNR